MDASMEIVDQNTANQVDTRDSLVTITRRLDQLGPGQGGENLTKLWKALSESPASQGYAAEQASLRWLLKVMNASTKSLSEHEVVRRYPLTWDILNQIFKTTPLSNLIKALTDRKFIAVLQQCLDDLSSPTTINQIGSSRRGSQKRKRTPTVPFDLGALKRPENCIHSAQAMFNALNSLLSRFSDATNIGGYAYDARTLFPPSAVEAAKLVSPMFDICALAHREGEIDNCDRRSWTTIPAEIWTLRIPHPADAGMLASHPLCQTVFRLLLNMEFGRAEYHAHLAGKTSGPKTRLAWGVCLYEFLLDNIIGPASRDVMFKEGAILKHLVNSLRGFPPKLLQALYDLAQDCPAPADEASREKIHDWMNEVLKAISIPLSEQVLETRSSIMKQILAMALEKGTRIREEMLESISTVYGFNGDRPLWPILALVLKINPDIVFRKIGEETLLERIRRCLEAGGNVEDKLSDVMSIAEAIVRAFNNMKNLGDFFKLWYEELCRLEKVLRSDASRMSPWLDLRFRYGNIESWSPAAMAERFMTTSQLASFLDWLLSLDDLRAGPAHVIAESLASSLRLSEFTDVLGPKIVQLVVKTLDEKDAPEPMQNLQWPALAKVVGWLTPEDRDSLWRHVGPNVKEILKCNSDLDRHVGAFKFLIAVWVAMVPNGAHLDDVVSTVLISQGKLAGTEISRIEHDDSVRDGDTKTALYYYLDHLVLETSRPVVLLHGIIGESFSESWDKICDTLKLERVAEMASGGETVSSLELFSRALIQNENNLNNRAVIGHVVDNMIATFILSTETNRNLRDKLFSCKTARLLLLLPNECMTRPQREKLLGAIFGVVRRSSDVADGPVPELELLLSLIVKIMKRSTFYEGMKFGDLSILSEALSGAFVTGDRPLPVQETNSLTALYGDVASGIIRQMATHLENWGQTFFDDAREWVRSSQASKDRISNWSCLHTILLAALIQDLQDFPIFTREPYVQDLEDFRRALAAKISSAFPSDLSGLDPPVSPLVTSLLVSLKASEVLECKHANPALATSLPKIRKWSKKSASARLHRGWKVLAFLLRHWPEPDDKWLDIFALARPAVSPATRETPMDLVTGKELEPLVLECTDAVMKNLESADEKAAYVVALIDQLLLVQPVIEISAVRQGVEHIIGLTTNNGGKAEISPIYSRLVTRTRSAKSGRIFSELCSLLHLILDSSARISQENIDETLSLAASFVSSENNSIRHLEGSRKTYEWLCKLVELIVKKYRLRIEGHFHALIQTLQSLLASLLRHPYDADRRRFVSSPPLGEDESRLRYWRDHATAYNRLLTAVCEPTAGSAARLHGNKQSQNQKLDAAADVAKRAAGRRMYLVLAAYVRLQVEAGVPRGVREALEPGVNAIFDVTPQEVRQALGDALDREGRDILGGMYRRYRMFGKWSGK